MMYPPRIYLTVDEAKDLASSVSDPTLLGNRLEAVFKLLGIPPCPDCEARKAWINKAHIILRSLNFNEHIPH